MKLRETNNTRLRRYIIIGDNESYLNFIAQLKEDIKFSEFKTQKAIAKMIRVSRATINKMLNGDGNYLGRACQVEALLGNEVVILPKQTYINY